MSRRFGRAVSFISLISAGILSAAPDTHGPDKRALQKFAESVGATEKVPLRAEKHDAARRAQASIPVYFEPNHGQFDPNVLYVARESGQTMFLTKSEAVITAHSKQVSDDVAVIRMQLCGSKGAKEITPEEPLAGRINYILGNQPSKWYTDIPTFGGVIYREVYNGIDLFYHGQRNNLEYDFRVAPGADPEMICVAFEGAKSSAIDRDGNLELRTVAGVIKWMRPVSYQEIDGQRRSVASRYVLRNGRVTFQAKDYDRTRPLTIDPTLVYSSYLGGADTDFGQGAAIDTSGNSYVAGITYSVNFPLSGALQTSLKGTYDAFVTKINSTGAGLVYSTYFGGTGNDSAYDIAVDPNGNAAITGLTTSANLPITSNPFQSTYSGPERCAFVTVFNQFGSSLVYSSYFGGSADNVGEGVAYDLTPQASGVYLLHVAGYTSSTDFPTTSSGYQRTNGGGYDAFAAVFNQNANLAASLVYSTYLGGASNDFGYGVAVDPTGTSYVVGQTYSTNFPTTPNAYSITQIGAPDIFVARIDSTKSGGAALEYSTYFGGTATDDAYGIAVDGAGNAYVVGDTNSSNFPITPGAYQPNNSGSLGTYDGYVTKINPNLSKTASLIYSTYLGGSSFDTIRKVRVDGFGKAYIIGYTTSTNYPTSLAAYQTTFAGTNDAFFTILDTAASGAVGLVYSTYLGGNGVTVGLSIAFDGAATAVLTGYTTAFPTTSGVFQPTFGGIYDAFVAKFNTKITPSVKVALFVDSFWFIDQNNDHQYDVGDKFIQWGFPGVLPVMGDWSGSGSTKIGLYYQGFWYLDYNGDGIFEPGVDKVYYFGNASATPIVGDWNGSGTTKIGIYVNGSFILDANGDGVYEVGIDPYFGLGPITPATPIVGDWNRSGTTKVGVFQRGFWWLDMNGNQSNVRFLGWGQPSGVPVVGDWNGSGSTKIGSWSLGQYPGAPNVGQFVLDVNGDLAYEPGTDAIFPWGDSSSIPVVGDWNGSGTSKIGVFSNGIWVLDVNGDFIFEPATEFPFQFGGCGGASYPCGQMPMPGRW